MEQTEPWTPGQIILLVLIIAVIVALGLFVLKGSPACACDNGPFQTINSGLAP